MVETGIMRTPSGDERRDFKQLGDVSPKEKFLKDLSIVEAKFTKEHNPFDGLCARMDFEDEIEDIAKESERIYGYVNTESFKDVKFDDLEKYGDIDRFDEIGEDEECKDRSFY